MVDEVLTLEEVAKLLKLNLQTVYRQARAGKIPAQKVGKSWRFSHAAIMRMLEGNTND
jgi:excisionase family DNA binding protein